MQYRARHIAPGVFRLVTNSLPDLNEGETVLVTIERGRSEANHKHQFAWIKDAWASLPESLIFEDWAANPETMRKRALIECGFFHQIILECGEDGNPKAVAKALRDARADAHGYALGVVRGTAAIVRWAESQSYQSMGGDRFKESKAAILDWIAGKLGVTPETLKRIAA